MQFKIEPLTLIEKQIHEKAMRQAETYRRCEAELLQTISQVDSARLYFKFNLTSAFAYCVEYLKLSPAVTSNFINVARKSREIPELKIAVEAGELSVATARKIVPILTRENQEDWIWKAKELPQQMLEREVAEVSPARERERMKPSKGERVFLEVSLSKEIEKNLRRAQDLLSQNHAASIEETLGAALKFYVEKHDPLKRPVSQTHASASNSRLAPSSLKTAVFQRDHRQCTGCGRTRFLHLHHKIPFSEGGATTRENLVTLCSLCHQRAHTLASM